MTYSIVARNADTGEMGVAVQTCFFGVGAIAPWARPGVGAVATQSMAEPAYGPRCLDSLAGGATAVEALDTARAADPSPALRQVGIVGVSGDAAVFTGESCIDYAGHVQGDGFAVQANMMAKPSVWGAMADAYTRATGPLARRCMAALRAAQAEGGDARGSMSAAMVIVGPRSTAYPWEGTIVNIRVDHHDHPLDELERVLSASEAFRGFSRAADAVFSGDGARGIAEAAAGLDLLPGDENLAFVHAAGLLVEGNVEQGSAEVRRLVAARPSWALIVRGFVDRGLLVLPADLDIETVLGG